MFESFVIMLREGIEAALVIGIILVVLKRAGRRDLERPVFWGIGWAILASIGAAVALQFLPINEETYEGTLYWVSALFVISMMVWVHRKSKTLRRDIEGRVARAMEGTRTGRNAKEGWALGAFAFLMVFREGAEAVMFLSAVSLTTSAMLSLIGSLLGLALAVAFCVLFIRGSFPIDLRRFFFVTEWVLGIFVMQLLVNGYHEFSETGVIPSTQSIMAWVGLIVRHNALFVLAMVAIPLFLWLSKQQTANLLTEELSVAQRRLLEARVRRERFYRYGAVASMLVVLVAVGVLYAREVASRDVPPPEPVSRSEDAVVIPLERLDDGNLHRLGFLTEGGTVRFLAIKTPDGKYRTALDVCEVCGPIGYVQQGENLLCLNCSAEINAFTVGIPGGCNPIPLDAETTPTQLRVQVTDLTRNASLFNALC